MKRTRRRAVLVATAVKWLLVVAAVAAPIAATGVLRTSLFVVALVGAALRLDERFPQLTFVGTVIMAAAAVGAAAASGGADSYAFVAVFLAAADGGVQRGGGVGAIVGAAAAAGTVGLLALDTGAASITASEVFTLALTPLTGLAFGTVHRDLPITGVVALRATATALDELLALSERVRPGLDRWGVAEAFVGGLHDEADVTDESLDGPHLFIAVDGVLHGVGPPWDRGPVGLVVDLPRVQRPRPVREVARSSLPSAVAERLDARRWLVHRLDPSTGGGAVLIDARTPPTVVDKQLETVATATIALANSARFERLQRVASDAARTRMASDLHDGVAQSLTHVRLELELLALRAEHAGEELERARRATEAALTEVRATIGELREELPLSRSLTRHVETVRSFARVPIGLVVDGDEDPPAATGHEVLRIAQEALANALRHSGCDEVTIELQLLPTRLRLRVTDDGHGVPSFASPGIGLTSMRERAASIGGDLTLSPGPHGGTRVELVVDGVADGDGDGGGAVVPDRPSPRGPLHWLRSPRAGTGRPRPGP